MAEHTNPTNTTSQNSEVPMADNQSITHPTTEGGSTMNPNVYIFETLIGIGEGNTIWAQVVTNRPNPTEQKLYNRLMELREDNHIIAAEIKLRRETGREFRIKGIGQNYRFHMLQGRIQRKGFDYRLEYIKLKERDEFGNVTDLIGEEQIPLLTNRIMGSTRSWSTSTSTNILYVVKKGETAPLPWEAFDSALGLHTGNSPKQSKREAENSRTTELGRDFKAESVNIHIYEPQGDEMGVDGHFIISESFFKKIVEHPLVTKQRQAQMMRQYRKGEMVSFNGRILCELGLIKGDCHVAPDVQLKVRYNTVDAPDIVTAECNVKTEKGTTDGSVSITLTPHHPHHTPNASSQLLSWLMGFIVTEEQLKDDYTAMVNEFVSSLAQGRFPKHLMKAAPLHDEDDDFNEAGYINALHDSTQRWLASGMNLTHSSHLVRQHAGGFELKLKKAILRLALPLGWSTMAHAVTVEILEMGGWDLSSYDTTKMFWHAPTGRMAWPTETFIKNYSHHGGHDLDDTHTITLRAKKVDENDNPNAIWNMGGQDWCIKAIMTRSPNGLSYFGENDYPGEYSIEDIDLGLKITQFGFIALPTMNFPLYNVYSSIPMVDMDKAPKNTHHQDIEAPELPNDGYVFNDHPYSPEDAVRQFKLAMANPGIGQIINPLIAYSAIFGTYPKSLPAYLEQMVDALEQTPDMEAFKKVLEAKAQILIAIQYHTTRKVDHYIAKRRVPNKVFKVLKDQGRITKDGPFTRLVDHMRTTMEQAMEIMVGNRNPNPKLKTKGLSIDNRTIIGELMDMEVSLDAKRAAHDLIRYFGATRKDAPKARFDKDEATNLWLKRNDPYMSYAVRQYFISLNNECVKRITEHEVDTNEIITAIYQIIITDNVEDDILFQTGEAGTVTGVMDLFMQTLWSNGIIEEIIDPENVDVQGTLG